MINPEALSSEQLALNLKALKEFKDVAGKLKEKVTEYFNEFDDDKNGYLDRDELKVFLEKFFDTYKIQFPLTEEYVDEVFKKFDDNGDGKIQPDELEGFTMHFVERLIPEYEKAFSA